jgi:REP element-mobilizing transposase RayT
MKKELSRRKNIRLENYDYSQAGCYYITICVKDKHPLLWEVTVGANCVRPNHSEHSLSEYGIIIEKELSILSEAYDAVDVIKYVVMPNHIHMIITIANDGRTQFAPTISRAVKQFKGSITKKIGFSIWQKSFHDRIIRSEEEYLRIWKYIDENPINWEHDEYNLIF